MNKYQFMATIYPGPCKFPVSKFLISTQTSTLCIFSYLAKKYSPNLYRGAHRNIIRLTFIIPYGKNDSTLLITLEKFRKKREMSHACNNISKNWVAIFNKNLL
jgi:hypothetical protein